MTDTPATDTLRDRIRRAICEASGFTWLHDELMEPDEYGEHADAVLAVLPAPTDRAAVLREAIPAWEAVYAPGNVSDYLIGYANSEAAAKGAAEAWLRSQKDEVGSLEWVLEDQLASGRYERWYELLEHHADGVDIGPGIIVRRLADETPGGDR